MGMYDTWYSNVLKTKIYPQYSNFKKLYDREEAKEIKGSAYSELQELIGLDSAKSVIEKAITYSKAQKIFADKGMKESRTAMHMVQGCLQEYSKKTACFPKATLSSADVPTLLENMLAGQPFR